MLLENQSFKEITPMSYDIVSLKKFIEKCGRTCYRSESLITDDSYINFYDNAIKQKHFSILEHGTVYLSIRSFVALGFETYLFYKDNKYSKTILKGDDCFITTNLRVIVENNRIDDLRFMVAEPTYHIVRRTIELRTSIQVYKELTRHRSPSFCVESTRYCNYSSDKFNNSIKFLIPFWFKHKVENLKEFDTNEIEKLKDEFSSEEKAYLYQMIEAEDSYNIISEKLGPQAAAYVLPQSTMASVVITANTEEWNHIFALRAFGETGTPHPDTKNLMLTIYNNNFKR